MHWRIKGLAQKVLGVMPAGDKLHYRMQRGFGGLRDFSRELAVKVEDWQIMIGHLRSAGVAMDRARFFEIGTGWYPTFPFALYLAGARRVTTYDLTRHLQMGLVHQAIAELSGFLDVIAATSGADPMAVRDRHQRLQAAIRVDQDLAAITDGVIHYAAPADATRTALADGEVDVVFSNSVLEHVPPDAITAMYRESLRILAPGGIMFHSVNCGDHYAYVDSKVHQLNYLRYSDRQWKFWDNAFLYQNRMRAHEFVERAAAVGYVIELDTSTARAQRLEQLAAMKVDTRFAHVPPEKLCITSVDFIARKPA